jgi:alpha-tubulin suppressor-like RCC1 family protein
MAAIRFAALVGALAACSGGAHSHAGLSLVPDAGDASVLADASCGAGNVSCGGVCMQESPLACGSACVLCGQPAASHGVAECLGGRCEHRCEIGYSACGEAGCCGGDTAGDVAAIAVGGESSCGVTRSGAAQCWGDGSYGTLGNGAVQVRTSYPVAVKGLGSRVAMLSLGDRHACAVSTSGALACWGDDREGQLGDGARMPRSDPFSPPGLQAGVASVSAGALHTCVVTTAGGAKCWGNNVYGQVGNGTSSGVLVPADVVGLGAGVASLAAGSTFTCAVMQAGGVKCWGDGTYGQLGGSGGSTKPIDVAVPGSVKSVVAGGRHACALASDSRVLCWGANDVHQLGVTGPSARAAPAPVPGVENVVVLAAGGNETCAIDAGGGVRCWGADPIGDVGPGPGGPDVVPSLASGIASITVVAGHACAVTTGGAPKCWGANASGQLGDGTTIDSWVPVDVLGI